jgi:hypothetical protein
MSSSSVELLQCVECDEKFYFPGDMCLYWMGTGPEFGPSYRSWDWVAVLRLRVWCGVCNCPSYAERLPRRPFLT